MDVFQLLADPTRRRIIQILAEGERAVMDLVSAFDISQPSISQQLRVLREGGLVSARKEGRRRIYELDARRLKEAADWIAAYEKFWDDKLDRLGSYLDAQAPRPK